MTPQQRFDVVVYRMESAKRLLAEIESHIDDGYYNTAINRMYYACFYAVSALLIHNEIDGLKTHEGVRQHFGKNFIVTGKMDRKWGHFYTSLYTSRSAADYEDFKEYNEVETRSFFPEVKRFITLIDEMIFPESKG